MAKKQMRECACGCGFLTASTWYPGHDGVHKGKLIQRMKGGDEAAMQELVDRGWLRTGEGNVQAFRYQQAIELPVALVETEDEKLMQKVANILALRANAGTEEEAQAAAAMAQKLAFKYNLDLDAIERGNAGVGKRPIVKGTIEVGGAGWARTLVGVVMRNNFCRVVTHGDSPYVSAIGERHNLLIGDYIFAFVVYEINRLADLGWKGRDKAATYETAQNWKRGFREGAVTGVSAALAAQRADDMNNVQGGSALVIVKDREVDDAMKEYFPNLRAGRSRTVRYGQGYDHGYSAGKNIQIRKGVEGGVKIAGRLAG